LLRGGDSGALMRGLVTGAGASEQRSARDRKAQFHCAPASRKQSNRLYEWTEGWVSVMLGTTVLGFPLVVLPIVVLEWLVSWLLRYVPAPIKNPLIRVPAQIAIGGAIGGLAIAQLRVYQLAAGFDALRGPNRFLAAFVIGQGIALGIGFQGAWQRRKRDRGKG